MKLTVLLELSKRSSLYVRQLRTFMELVYKILQSMAPPIESCFHKFHEVTYNLGDKHTICKPRYQTQMYGFHSLKFQGPYIWNQLPLSLKNFVCNNDFNGFKDNLKSWLPRCSCGLCV